MPLEIKRKQRENVQTLMRRFQKAVQQSGILLEVRKRQLHSAPNPIICKKKLLCAV